MKHTIFIVAVLILSFIIAVWIRRTSHSKKLENPQIVNNLNKTDTISKVSTVDKSNESVPQQNLDTLLKNDSILIIREHGYSAADTFKRYKPAKTYKDYQVTEQFKGQIPPLDFSTCKYGNQYITITKNCVMDGANFAGHYVFAYWRDGSNYYMSSVVDLKTGKVYAGPNASNYYDFKLNSNMIIANLPDSLGWYPTEIYFGKPTEYIWTGKKFKQLD